MKRSLVLLVILALYLLHYDFWLWRRPDMVLGLPVGLIYHFSYCFAVSFVLALLVRFAWRTESTAS